MSCVKNVSERHPHPGLSRVPRFDDHLCTRRRRETKIARRTAAAGAFEQQEATATTTAIPPAAFTAAGVDVRGSETPAAAEASLLVSAAIDGVIASVVQAEVVRQQDVAQVTVPPPSAPSSSSRSWDMKAMNEIIAALAETAEAATAQRKASRQAPAAARRNAGALWPPT